MEIQTLLKEARQIWGNEPQTLEHITVALGVVYGDICRQARQQLEDGTIDAEELQKEMGNVIFSLIRWCDDLGFDPEQCIQAAITSQKRYAAKRN